MAERATYKRSEWWSRHVLYAPRVANSRRRWMAPFDATTALLRLTEPWFVWRGHASVDWPLTSSLHRKLVAGGGLTSGSASLDEEVRLLVGRARARRFDRTADWDPLPELPLLALLQHHGAATPFIDVTTDPYVALYFASLPHFSEGEESHGVLLAINVQPKVLYNRDPRAVHFDVDEGGDVDENLVTWMAAKQQLFRRQVGLGLYTPPLITNRVLAQRGRFIFGVEDGEDPSASFSMDTVSEWRRTDLDQLFQPRGQGGRLKMPTVIGILVHRNEKAEIRSVLERKFGLTAETLFPDLGGFAAANSANGRVLAQQPDRPLAPRRPTWVDVPLPFPNFS